MLIIRNEVSLWITILSAFTCTYITQAQRETNFDVMKLNFELIQWYENLFKTSSSTVAQKLENESNKSSNGKRHYWNMFGFAKNGDDKKQSGNMRRHHNIILDKINNGNTAEKLVIIQIQMLAFFQGFHHATCALTTAHGGLTPVPYCRETALNLFNFSLMDSDILSASIYDVTNEEKEVIKKGFQTKHSLLVKLKSQLKNVEETKSIPEQHCIDIEKLDETFYNQLYQEMEFQEPHITNLMMFMEEKKGNNGKSNPSRFNIQPLSLIIASNIWQKVGKLYSSSFTEGDFDPIKALKYVQKNHLMEYSTFNSKETGILNSIEYKKFDIQYENKKIKVLPL